MPRLLLATNNLHKVREIGELLQPAGWSLFTPAQLDVQLEPEETEETYAGNAAIKALAFASAAGLAALADDSGLEVDALSGRPGVRSARYGGPDADQDTKIMLLLGELAGIPPELRSARFCCAVVIAAPDGRTWSAEGVCDGRIALEAAGEGGFGYDPIFLPAGQCRSMAELSSEEKNAISHRSIAMREAGQILAKLAGDPAFR